MLVLAALLCLPCPTSLAEKSGKSKPKTYTSGDYEYVLLKGGKAEITDYRGNEKAP